MPGLLSSFSSPLRSKRPGFMSVDNTRQDTRRLTHASSFGLHSSHIQCSSLNLSALSPLKFSTVLGFSLHIDSGFKNNTNSVGKPSLEIEKPARIMMLPIHLRPSSVHCSEKSRPLGDCATDVLFSLRKPRFWREMS